MAVCRQIDSARGPIFGQECCGRARGVRNDPAAYSRAAYLRDERMRYAPGYPPYSELVTPWREEPTKAACGPRICTRTLPVSPSLRTPACTAAVASPESSVYMSVPQMVLPTAPVTRNVNVWPIMA